MYLYLTLTLWVKVHSYILMHILQMVEQIKKNPKKYIQMLAAMLQNLTKCYESSIKIFNSKFRGLDFTIKVESYIISEVYEILIFLFHFISSLGLFNFYDIGL